MRKVATNTAVDKAATENVLLYSICILVYTCISVKFGTVMMWSLFPVKLEGL